MTSPVTPAMLSTMPEKTPTSAADAAKQFEALLLNQMLRSVREESADDDEDSTGATMFDVADQQFSQLLANNGGMGLAKMITKGLTKESKTDADSQ